MTVIRRGALALALLALAGAWSAAGAEEAQVRQGIPETGSLKANMDNVLLEDFIRFIGKYSGQNIIYQADQIPKTKFNIYSQQAITEPELMAIFHQLLETSGLQAVAKGDALYVFPVGAARAIPPAVKQSDKALAGTGEELVVTVYQVAEDVPTAGVASLLNGLKSQVGSVQEIPQARAIMISDKRDQIKRMLKIMNMVLKLSPEWKVEVLPLAVADATGVVTMLSEMYAELVKRGKTSEIPLMKPIVWTNSVLFAGTASQLEDVKGLLQQIDHVDQAASGLRVYRLKNAKASSVAQVLQSLVEVIVENKGETSKKTVSDAFKVAADEDTNSVLVISSKEILPQIEEIMTELDKPQDQVYIEALIMETSLNDSREFGVEWMAGGASSGETGTIGFVDSSSSSFLTYADPVYGSTSKTMPEITSLPGGFSLGILGNIISYGGKRYPTIGALVNVVKTVDGINILSTPQVMTLDNTDAEVFVGENRPYQTTTSYDSSNKPVYAYDYRDVGVSLKVKPSINRESGLVRLEVEQSIDKVQSSSVSSTAPTTLKRSTKTTVQLMDGGTMVISGMVDNTNDKSKVGIPGLANIPVLGWLFKKEADSNDKTTIMVFISAKIISTASAAHALTHGKLQDVQSTNDTYKDFFEKQFEIEFGDKKEEGETPPAVTPDSTRTGGPVSLAPSSAPSGSPVQYGAAAGSAQEVAAHD
ncbi:MAG: type II secretion system secretin GspD [Desulfovibrionaceae bacterium]